MSAKKPRQVDAAGEVWRLMSNLVLNNERRREVCDYVGLSFGKIKVLRLLVNRPLPMGELAALVNMDPPNLTSVIDDLQRAGLVERRAHPSDRRVQLVVDTSDGETLAHRAEEILHQPPKELSQLSMGDIETLLLILSRTRTE
jgi:DNA-binding MarR family transcriptional regulator